MPSQPSFDPAAARAAARGFADLLVHDPCIGAIGRIEVTLCGRGPIERLFVVEAALVDAWPSALHRPAHDLVCATGELGGGPGLTFRALDADGAEVLRRVYDLGAAEPKRRARAAHAHG